MMNTNNIVSRYEPCLDFDDESKFASMEDCDRGGYVSYSDYKELESKFEQLQKEHEELKKEKYIICAAG